MDSHQRERRLHKRVPVSISTLDSTEFRALDLSESGMRLSSLIEQREGRRCELKLHLGSQVLRLHAEVIWCQKASSVFESGYHVGVKFVGYSIGDQLILREFIDNYDKTAR